MNENNPKKLLKKIYNVEVIVDTETDVTIWERWRTDGVFDRRGGPAEIMRDSGTGVTTLERWYRDGMLHRDDETKPAITLRHASTGEVFQVRFFENDVETRSVRTVDCEP